MRNAAEDSSSDIVEIISDSITSPPITNPPQASGNGPLAQALPTHKVSDIAGSVKEKKKHEGEMRENRYEFGVSNTGKGKEATGFKESEEPSRLAALQSQIKALADIQAKIAALRSIPTHLVILHQQSPLIDYLDSMLNIDAASDESMKSHSMGSQAKTAFRMLNEAKEEIVKGTLQNALKSAQQSQQGDRLDLFAVRRRARRKRRTVTADSPMPFSGPELQKRLTFPLASPNSSKIRTFTDLVEFIKGYRRPKDGVDLVSRSSNITVSIWLRSRPPPGSRFVSDPDPLSVRASIRDVANIFIKLRRPHFPCDDELLVESTVAFGTREKKPASSHSDFFVFQKLSQQMTRMLEQDPKVSLGQFMDLVHSYESLFVKPCSVCELVLSQDKHIPPVARVWVEDNSVGDSGHWDARHASCLQN